MFVVYKKEGLSRPSILIISLAKIAIICELAKCMRKMHHGTYGKHFETRMCRIGLYIVKNIFIKLGVNFIEKNKKIRLPFGKAID